MCYGLDVFKFQILDFRILFYHTSSFSVLLFPVISTVVQNAKFMSLSQNTILQNKENKDHIFFLFTRLIWIKTGLKPVI